MANIKVAVCEDNEQFRESLIQFIDDSPGYKIVFALASAENLVSSIENTDPDIILMDIDMPGISGIRATELIKAAYPNINVLILTVYEDDQKIFDAILAGATGYLLKKNTAIPHTGSHLRSTKRRRLYECLHRKKSNFLF